MKTNVLVPFYKLPPNHTDFICFDKLSVDDLKTYFFNVLGDITISNENNLMDYQTRDALNSLICFYEPDTDFKSADTKAVGSDLHRFFQSSYKNYKARIHKASLEKSAKKI